MLLQYSNLLAMSGLLLNVWKCQTNKPPTYNLLMFVSLCHYFFKVTCCVLITGHVGGFLRLNFWSVKHLKPNSFFSFHYVSRWVVGFLVLYKGVYTAVLRDIPNKQARSFNGLWTFILFYNFFLFVIVCSLFCLRHYRMPRLCLSLLLLLILFCKSSSILCLTKRHRLTVLLQPI